METRPTLKKILISNDDGVFAPGIQALANKFREAYDVYVVAPMENQSGKSLALTLHQPLRISNVSDKVWGVNGTPADCVHMALHEILDFEPDFVLSGINAGGNLGRDTLYSGTVAATVEASFRGIPALAISVEGTPFLFEDAAKFTFDLVENGLFNQLNAGKVMNLNIPSLPYNEIRGPKPACLGNKVYEPELTKNTDPRGGKYYWIGGSIDTSKPEIPDSDGDLLLNGFAAITVLHPSYEDKKATDALADHFKNK